MKRYFLGESTISFYLRYLEDRDVFTANMANLLRPYLKDKTVSSMIECKVLGYNEITDCYYVEWMDIPNREYLEVESLVTYKLNEPERNEA